MSSAEATQGAASAVRSGYTPGMTPISAVLIVQNEERDLPDALESVSFCDETLVVDGGSKDRTLEIAAAAGARVVVNAPWPGFREQREFSAAQARHDWLLFLDADERVSPRLREEILGLRAEGFAHAGYRIPRLAFYLGRWIRGTDWHPDFQLRLFDRRRGGWQGLLVHESVRVEGTAGRLRGDILHYPYRDISHHLQTIDRYTTLWSRQAYERGKRASLLEAALGTLAAFLRNYVIRGGFLLGRAGITVSVLNTVYTLAKYVKLQELQRLGASPDRPGS
jgi:glycosyltransferase involved in cell wall biosynthesis